MYRSEQLLFFKGGVSMKLKKTRFDILLNVLCLLQLIGITLFLLICWAQIPQQIPMHYDLGGNITRWGNKAELIIIPVLAWIMYLLMTVLEHFPQAWNTGVQVTEHNRARVYATLLHMISSLKFLITCLYTYSILQTALMLELPSWFLFAVIALLCGDIGYWMYRLWKCK